MINNERTRYISRLSENRFEQLCIYSHLSCSPPKRDENGWDALVEFPTNRVLALHRDGQPPAIKCLIQVKSTDGALACPIEMTISNWEKLAQSSLPSFLVIFYFDGKQEPQEVYVCHFDSHRIYKTLQKVREIEHEQALSTLNHRKMMFVPREQERLDLGLPQALRELIAASTGLDAAAYAERKATILRQVGFDMHSHTLKFSAAIPVGELSDVFLGLTEFKVQDVSIGSRRFGIELLDYKFDLGVLQVKSVSSGKCKIAASSRVQKARALIDAEIFSPAIPGLPLDARRTLIISNEIKIEVTSSSGSFSAQLSDEKVRDFKDVLQEAKFLWVTQQRDARLTIILPNGELPLEFSSALPRVPFFFETYKRLQIVEKALHLATFRDPIQLLVKDLFDQDVSMRWFQCLTRKSAISLDAINIPSDLFSKAQRGHFGCSVWFRCAGKFLVLLCIWNADIRREGNTLGFNLRRCRVFESFLADDVVLEAGLCWQRFESFCRDEAGKAPLMLYGPPVKLDPSNSSAKLLIK